MRKIEIIGELYNHKAKDVLITSKNDYEFFYKNIKVSMTIGAAEILFISKKIGKKEYCHVFSYPTDDLKQILKKAFKRFDKIAKGEKV